MTTRRKNPDFSLMDATVGASRESMEFVLRDKVYSLPWTAAKPADSDAIWPPEGCGTTVGSSGRSRWPACETGGGIRVLRVTVERELEFDDGPFLANPGPADGHPSGTEAGPEPVSWGYTRELVGESRWHRNRNLAGPMAWMRTRTGGIDRIARAVVTDLRRTP